MTEITLNRVPGMTEPVEQQYLFNCGSQTKLNPGDMLVDFGPFLGRSTYYLAAGLSINPTRSDNKVIAYDGFVTQRSNPMFQRIYQPVAEAGIKDLLKENNGIIDWKKCTEHFLKQYIPEHIVLEQCALFDSFPKTKQGGAFKSIAILHVDSPKKWEYFIPILFRFFPLLKESSIVIFQDYFYHWSANLVAGIYHMMENGNIAPLQNNASAMVFKVTRRITSEDAMEIAIKEQAESAETADIVLKSLKHIQKYAKDRPNVFIPRLYLAAIQVLQESNRYREAASMLRKVTNYVLKGQAHPSILQYYAELVEVNHKMSDW